MKKHIRNIALALALILALSAFAGCNKVTPGNQNADPTAAPVSSIHLAAGTGYAAKGDIEKAYIASMNRFTVALMDNMGEDWTGVVSPLSFAMMLELLANGAGEQDSKVILDALMTELGMEATNENDARLITALERSVKAVTGADAEKVRRAEGSAKLNLLSAILVASGERFSEDFEHNAADYYNASIGAIDFKNTQAALEEINGWVSNNTNGLIPALFDDISADTTMALLNALYFNARWEKPFVAYRGFDEADSIFHGVNGDAAVSMLRCDGEKFAYGEFGGHQVVLVPYAGGEFYMAVVLPEKSSSPAAALAAVIDHFGECSEASVSLTMPSIELSTKFDAMEILPGLGLEGISSGNMQFGGIVDNATIQLTQFVHASVLKVTEAGTEAAAATGVTGTKNGGTIFVDMEHSLVCNRPYAMAIVHASTGAVLFASTVNDVPAN